MSCWEVPRWLTRDCALCRCECPSVHQLPVVDGLVVAGAAMSYVCGPCWRSSRARVGANGFPSYPCALCQADCPGVHLLPIFDRRVVVGAPLIEVCGPCWRKRVCETTAVLA